ncbi:MAG: hypothetical protein RL248_726 [Pseudomonadota bacterium]|jgi:IS1 family transposase
MFSPRTDETCRHLLVLLELFHLGFITRDERESCQRKISLKPI